MGFYSDRVFPLILDYGQPRGMQRQRELALKGVSGAVLEIGIGTGSSLSCYPGEVRSVSAVETSSGMVRRMRRRQPTSGPTVDIHQLDGERLPFEDESFDSVVALLLLCSTREPRAVLSEIRRVLRPSGRYYFLEHVLAAKPRLRRWQRRLNTIHRLICCGCQLTLDTEQLIQRSGLTMETIDHGRFPLPHTIYPVIRGVAMRS